MYVKLTKLYRETGFVDKERVPELAKRFKVATSDIKTAINTHHKENDEQKNSLIEQARKIVEGEGQLEEKISQLKNLQNKWQKIGFAGKGRDQKLWNEFRGLNNQVFAIRDEQFKQRNEAASEAFNEITSQLTAISEAVTNAEEINSLNQAIEQVRSITADLSNLNKSLTEKAKKQANGIVKQAEARVSNLRSQREKQIYVNLFDVVQDIAQGNATDTSELKPSWQSALNFNNKEDREDVTLMLELTAGVDSPANDQDRRNQVQMTMLSKKLEEGQEYDLQELLETWLSAGIFEQQDIELVKRVKPIFVSE
jgi:vacuolar-type H+-ATPase subunit I/STV1